MGVLLTGGSWNDGLNCGLRARSGAASRSGVGEAYECREYYSFIYINFIIFQTG